MQIGFSHCNSTILPRCPFYLVLAPQNIEKRTPATCDLTTFGSTTLKPFSASIYININESNTKNSRKPTNGIRKRAATSSNLHMSFKTQYQGKRITNIEFLKQKTIHESRTETLEIKVQLQVMLEFIAGFVVGFGRCHLLFIHEHLHKHARIQEHTFTYIYIYGSFFIRT